MTTSPRVRVALVGTTASGKSALAHDVARQLAGVEIATVDSMTVYREMNIGTAKPTREERAEVTYHLLDLVDPSEEFTVAQFQRAAHDVESDVAARERALLYVGGTGLYGRAVIDELEIPAQYPELRAQLEQRARDGLDTLYRELLERDPIAAARMEPTNERRIVRALEVTLGSERPFSSFGPGLEKYPPARMVQVGLRREFVELDLRIEQRFARWMREGLLDEVAALRERAGALSRTARQAVGYRELLAHLDDGVDLDESVANAISATRRLARRQRAWFARDPRIEWFDDPATARERLLSLLSESPANVAH